MNATAPNAVPEDERDPDRLNRVVLLTLGLALVVVGIVLLARSYGWIGDTSSAPILGDRWRTDVLKADDWFWPAAAMACTMLALLALRWLRAQLQTRRAGNADLARDGILGATHVSGSGVAAAFAEDIEDYDDVERAVARISGDAEHPVIDLRVDVGRGADLPSLQTRIEHEALQRLCFALETDAVAMNLRFRLKDAPGKRVA